MKSFVTIALLIACVCSTRAPAQVLWAPNEDREADVPEVVRMTVDAAGEPRPALRYTFLPKYGDRKPGNGAPYYYRAILAHTDFRGRLQALPEEDRAPLDSDFRVSDWTLDERDKFPRERARKLVEAHKRILDELKIAANREECDWELRFRDLGGMQSIAFVLEEFQTSRSIARMLNVKVRLEIVEGRHEDAIETLGLGFQMGRDIGRVPILINDLIGIAFASIMRQELTELLATPGCPNLYWALADIGEPYSDMETSMRQEALLGENIFPFLKDADTAIHTDEEWDRIIREASADMDELVGLATFGRNEELAWLADMHSSVRVARGYPAAVERLVEAGYDRAEVEAMPVGRVIAIDEQRTYRYVRDEVFKWMLLPGRERWKRSREVERRLRDEGYLKEDGIEVLPIAATLLPAVAAASTAELRIERDLRALRVIEALRMYAAEHGRFPASLDDITAVPIPDDPWNNAAFPYRLEEGKAILEAPAPEGMSKRAFGRIYELTLRK